MKTTFHPIALIAGGLPLVLTGWAGATVLVPVQAGTNSYTSSPGDMDTGSAEGPLGPLAHTDQGKAKDVQAGRTPTFVHPSRPSGMPEGFGDEFPPADIGAVVFDETPQFNVHTHYQTPLFSTLKLMRDATVEVTVPGGGFSITPVTTGAIPTPGSGLLLVLGGLVSVGARRRR